MARALMEELTDETSLAAVLQNRLGKAIVCGQMRDCPTEQGLSNRYGASRTVVREALKMLRAKGLVRSRQGVGIQPTLINDWNLLDPDVAQWLMEGSTDEARDLGFVELGRVVMSASARSVAELATPSVIAMLCEHVADMRDHTASADDLIETVFEFHQVLLRCSRNLVFQHLKTVVRQALRICLASRPPSDVAELHSGLVKAIQVRSLVAIDRAAGEIFKK